MSDHPLVGRCLPLRPADIRVENPGTVWLLVPLTEAGRAWLAKNVTAADYRWVGGSLAVERRFVWDIVVAMAGDGLVIE